MSASSRLSRITLIAYGLPGMAAALPVIPIAVLLPSWYARDLGLGLVLTGAVIAASRLFDLVTDPLVGVLVDRFEWRGYHYKTWVCGGAVLAGVGLWLLAFPPPAVGPVWLAVGLVTLFSGWTAFMVPYTAWGAELSADIHERSLITGAREMAGLTGMLLALGLPAWLSMNSSAAAPAALPLIARTGLVVGLPALLALLWLVPEPNRLGGAGNARNAISWGDLRELLQFAPCRRTLNCWFVNGIANGLPAVLFPLIVSDLLQLDDEALYVLLTAYFLAAIVAAPLWLITARNVGKVNAWRVAIAVNIVVFAQALWLTPASANWFVVICVVSGATLGADLALPPSLQADVLDADRRHCGRSRAASAFALWSMATKLALALAIGVAFVGVGLAGKSSSSHVALLGCYVVLPVILKSLVWLQLSGRRFVDTQTPTQVAGHRANHG